MRRFIGFICFFFLTLSLMSCGNKAVTSDFSGSAVLKDHAVVRYTFTLEFDNQKDRDDFMDKRDKINHAVRLILIQRSRNQIDSASRMMSVVNKVFKSLLDQPLKGISLTQFAIEP